MKTKKFFVIIQMMKTKIDLVKSYLRQVKEKLIYMFIVAGHVSISEGDAHIFNSVWKILQ